jgi:hypothetical protein
MLYLITFKNIFNSVTYKRIRIIKIPSADLKISAL